jgi:hypothetical protein
LDYIKKNGWLALLIVVIAIGIALFSGIRSFQQSSAPPPPPIKPGTDPSAQRAGMQLSGTGIPSMSNTVMPNKATP